MTGLREWRPRWADLQHGDPRDATLGGEQQELTGVLERREAGIVLAARRALEDRAQGPAPVLPRRVVPLAGRARPHVPGRMVRIRRREPDVLEPERVRERRARDRRRALALDPLPAARRRVRVQDAAA